MEIQSSKPHRKRRKLSWREQTMRAHRKLENAVLGGVSDQYRLRLWSAFIRARDGNRCVRCHSRKRKLSAHHILRKTFWDEGRYQTGNGITLCSKCHREAHKNFNGKPNLDLPMDAEGGENIDLMMEMYWLLLNDARDREILCDEFYFLSERILQSFKRAQTIEPTLQFPGGPLEQAYLIWRQTPRSMLKALLGANGIELPDDFIQLGGVTLFFEN